MRTLTGTRCLLALVATTSLLGATACGNKTSTAQPSTVPSTSSAASTRPLGDGDAAESTVMKSIQVRDEIGQDATARIEGLASVSRDDAYRSYTKQYTEWHEKGWTQKGDMKIISITESGKISPVKVNACIDVSGVDVVDAKGKSVVSSDRSPRTPVVFTVKQFNDGWFIIDENSSNGKC